MKITIKKAVYTKAYAEYLMKEVSKSAFPKKNTRDKKEKKIYQPPKKTQLVSETIEIPDELVNKTIAVIDELLDRSYDDWEERGWSGVNFPLIPFPFFHKNRLPENVGVDDYWISYWLDTTLMKTITERTRIIGILNALGGIEKIEHNPSINLDVGIFDGEEFNLNIKRDGLISIRKLLIEKQEKSTEKPEKQEETNKSLIRKTALQNIAVEIKELTSHSGLNDFFSDFNISKELYGEGSKYDKVFAVLSKVNQEMLFRIIEEAVHPLRFFGGDEEKALQMQDLFSSFLQFDGYCFQNGKIVKTTPEILKEIKARIDKRKEEQVSRTSDSGLMPTREPLHIVIDEVKKDIGIRGFEEKVILQKPKNKRIQLRKFPADTKWNDITVQFLNEHEVIIKAKNLTYQTNYEEMGFQDEKKKLPNKQWQFLKLLAFKNGEISWENNRDLSLQQINSIKKQKQLLTEALKAYFQIYDDEPFCDYKKEKAYKIKLNLTPESNTKTTPNEQEIFKEDDELGIKEAYKEQTPEISEE